MDTHSDGLPLPMQSHNEEDEDLDDPSLAAELQVGSDHAPPKRSELTFVRVRLGVSRPWTFPSGERRIRWGQRR
jgi:hypothetical protein